MAEEDLTNWEFPLPTADYEFTVYTWPNCDGCEKLKDYLTEKGKTFQCLDAKDAATKVMKKAGKMLTNGESMIFYIVMKEFIHGQTTFPMTFAYKSEEEGIVFLGGYRNTVDYVEEGKLPRLPQPAPPKEEEKVVNIE